MEKLKKAPKETHESVSFNLSEEIKASEIFASDQIPEQQVCFKIGDRIVGTLGDFSAIIGQAKSRKTFLITYAIVASLGTEIINMTANFGDKTTLYFDTEQSKYHTHKCLLRILKNANVSEQPQNLRVFGLRKYSPQQRFDLIEHALLNTPDLGLVVIDGIRDLVTSINNEEEASNLMTKILQWSTELNIHIIVALHENPTKGDEGKARGHVGTELINKAQTIISVSRNADNKDLSNVKCKYGRDIYFDDFSFGIDPEGVPFIAESELSAKPKIFRTPFDVETIVHKEIIKELFREQQELRYKALWSGIKHLCSKYGIRIGDNKAKDFVTFYVNEKYIIHHEIEMKYSLV